MIRVAEAARDWRTVFPNHIRNENNQVVEATAETIEVGKGAGLVPVITHMKVMGPKNWGKSEQTVGLLEAANARGTYAAADQYPYLASQTGLTAIVPTWVQEGGFEAMLARFADPELRPQIAAEIEQTMRDRVEGPDDVYFPTKRSTLADIAAEMGVEPGEATMRILETDGSLRTIYFFGDEADFKRIMQFPYTAVASDGGSSLSNETHPRHYGTQPTVLGEYVRTRGFLSLEDAVRKMTGLPATLIGMVDRGYLAVGMAADVTVFDPDTIDARATFEQPRQFAVGVEQVVVNGQLAIRDGELTGMRPGKALRRAGDMPSRPESLSGRVSMTAAGRVDGARLALHASQDLAGQRTAHGVLALIDTDAGIRFVARSLGRIQEHGDWATVTGRGRLSSTGAKATDVRANGAEDTGAEMAFTLILDRSNPLAGDETTVTVLLDNYRLHGTLSGASHIATTSR